MRKVSDILVRKGRNVSSVSASLPVIEALKMMANQNIGSVVIMEKDVFLGIMTERDYSRKVILMKRSSTDTTVGEIMTKGFPEIKETDSVEHCMKLMSDQNIRYLPVVENKKLCGIISMNDVVKKRTKQRTST